MRIRTAVLASVMFQLSMFGSGGAWAQTGEVSAIDFLDFGVPCKDPISDTDLPKPLNASVTAPSSDPSRPLSAPNYPPVSRRMNEQGTAVLRLMISETGAVSQARIDKSTGSPRLDNAALEVTRNWQLRPGKLKGEPHCMWGKFAVSFVLTDYPEDELDGVSVGPEARELAHHMMGIQPLKETALSADATSGTVARQMIELTVQAASTHSIWVAAEDKVARILATEFTTDELNELNRFFGSPVAAKWTSLTFKMSPTIMEQQRLVAHTLLCSTYLLDRGLKAKDSQAVLVDGAMSEQYRQAIPAFVEKSVPFCACLFKKERERAAAGGKFMGHCGLPPALE